MKIGESFTFVLHLPTILYLGGKWVVSYCETVLRLQSLAWSLNFSSKKVREHAKDTMARNAYLLWIDGGKEPVEAMLGWCQQRFPSSCLSQIDVGDLQSRFQCFNKSS